MTAGSSPATCPACGDPVEARFCEGCGYDVELGAPARPATLTLALTADKAHWDRVVGSGEPAYPTVPPVLTLTVSASPSVLGRVRSGAPVDVDLPLAGAAADPAVSHRQCSFAVVDGAWTVRDLGSSNGTFVNDADEPLAADAVHVLAEGDHILIGAWTCLTVHVAAAS